MRRFLFFVALAAVLLIGPSASAIEVGAVHTSIAPFDGARASGSSIWIMTQIVASHYDLPTGIILWTGDGSDYWMRFIIGEGGEVESLGDSGTGGQRIPSYFLLPLSAAYDSTANGDGTGGHLGYKKGLFVSSPTDSIFYRWTW